MKRRAHGVNNPLRRDAHGHGLFGAPAATPNLPAVKSLCYCSAP